MPPSHTRDEEVIEPMRRAFSRLFEPWQIVLPSELAWNSVVVVENDRGWAISCRIVASETDIAMYVYARHRMTNDRLYSINAAGSIKLLAAGEAFPSTLSDSDRLEAEFHVLVRQYGF